MTTQLTQEKKMKHYCIDHGHANYVTKFWGYVYCGRCGQQIGDQLGSIFDTRELMVIGHKCKVCNAIRKKLSKMDLKIVRRLEKELKSQINQQEKTA
jgi:hypothetical protein